MVTEPANPVNIDIRLATVDERPVVRQLMELYLYDFSELDGADTSPLGLYQYPFLDHYWVESGRSAYLVHVEGRLAGFVLVSRSNYLTGADDAWVMSEFFIMRKYRLRGVGEAVARWIFDHHHGTWQVGQIPQNTPATIFWRKVISRYTHDDYEEHLLDNEHWRGLIQVFSTGAIQQRTSELHKDI